VAVLDEVGLFSAEYSGPPPPAMIQAYEDIQEGLGVSLLNTTIENAKHIRMLEHEELRARVSEAKTGQFMAFGVAVTGLFCSVYLGVNEEPWLGAVIGGGTLVGIVAAFLKREGAVRRTEPLPKGPPEPAREEVDGDG